MLGRDAWSSCDEHSQGWYQASVRDDKAKWKSRDRTPAETPAVPFSQLSRSIQCFDEIATKRWTGWRCHLCFFTWKRQNLQSTSHEKNIQQINLEGIRNKMYLPNNPGSTVLWCHWTQHSFCYWLWWDPELSLYHFNHTLVGLALENHWNFTVRWRVNSCLYPLQKKKKNGSFFKIITILLQLFKLKWKTV